MTELREEIERLERVRDSWASEVGAEGSDMSQKDVDVVEEQIQALRDIKLVVDRGIEKARKAVNDQERSF